MFLFRAFSPYKRPCLHKIDQIVFRLNITLMRVGNLLVSVVQEISRILTFRLSWALYRTDDSAKEINKVNRKTSTLLFSPLPSTQKFVTNEYVRYRKCVSLYNLPYENSIRTASKATKFILCCHILIVSQKNMKRVKYLS